MNVSYPLASGMLATPVSVGKSYKVKKRLVP